MGAGGEEPFEAIYARAGLDLASIPWAGLAPNPDLVDWLASQPGGEERGPDPGGGVPALGVGCGRGGDARGFARRGYVVTAFDISPTAIEKCRERFPTSTVDYLVADLIDLPDG